MKTIMKKISVLLFAGLFAVSCNKSEPQGPAGPTGPTGPAATAPVITLDSENGIYLAKAGQQFSINPTVENSTGAVYEWKIDDTVIGTGPTLAYTLDDVGAVYIMFRVTAEGGTAQKELRVNVAMLAPPVISIAVPPGGLNVVAGAGYEISPDVQNGEDAVYEWTLNGVGVGTEKNYTFMQTVQGTYTLTLDASNADGAAEPRTITVNVVESLPVGVIFVPQSYGMSGKERNVFLGRTIYLKPVLENFTNPSYSWSVDGTVQPSATSQVFAFTPAAAGVYEVEVTVAGQDNNTRTQLSRNITKSGGQVVSQTVSVTCTGYGETDKYRPGAGAGSADWNRVYEYVPAPGQFINEPVSGYADVTTMNAAASYAEGRLRNNYYVSLGGFGGYIVVGFDHSIENKGGYDFSIQGNQFDESSEPGVVWVMQDVNGNGLPDDEWYELKGSETGAAGTMQDYAVTYFRPAAPRMSTVWMDNLGKTGSIDYLSVHGQEYYYPLWINTDTYTLYGTRLLHRTSQTAVGDWVNESFGWGYADNSGSDVEGGNPGGNPSKVYFKLANAVNQDGSPANLKYADFIKVQTAVNHKSGRIGEISTEVLGFTDENMQP